MPAGETSEDHIRLRQEESEQIDRDRANKSSTSGGLFRGWFQRTHPTLRATRDPEDGVDRCPVCNWELEDLRCHRCEIGFDSQRRMILRDGLDSWTHSSEDELDVEFDVEDDDGFDAFPTSTPGDGYSDFYSRDGTAAPSTVSPSYSVPEYQTVRARNGRITRSQRGLVDDFASLAESSTTTSNSDTVDEHDDGDEAEEEDESEDGDEESDSLRDFIDDGETPVQSSYPLWEDDPESEEEDDTHFDTILALSPERRRRPAGQSHLRNVAHGFRAAADLVSDYGIDRSPPPRSRRRRAASRHVENTQSDREDIEGNGLDTAGLSDAPVPNRRKRSRTESTSAADDTSSNIPSRSAARLRTQIRETSRTTRPRRSTVRGTNGAGDNSGFRSHAVPVDFEGNVSMSDSPNSTVTGRRSAYATLVSQPGLRTRANVGTSQDNAINLDGDSNLGASAPAFGRRRRETRNRRHALTGLNSMTTTRQSRRRAPTPHTLPDPESSDDAGTLTGITPGPIQDSEEVTSESGSLSSAWGTRRTTRSRRRLSTQANSSRNMVTRNRRGITQ